MRRTLTRLIYFLVFLWGMGMAREGRAQCSVYYGTMNYFCDLDSLLLYPVPLSGEGPWTYIWSTGETTDTIIIPLAWGDYLLTATDANGCTVVINCHVKPFPQVLYYPFNQNGCSGDTVTLFLEWFRDSIPGATYLWSTGETTPTIQITEDITWSVTVTDPSNGCEFIIPPSFFDFHETNTPVIEGPSSLCAGQSIILTVSGGPFGLIVWLPPNEWNDTLVVVSPGEYMVWASSPTAEYCWRQDTIIVTEGDIPPPLLDGPPDLCEGQTGVITVTNENDYVEFAWNNGETTSTIDVSQPGTYTVTVTNDGGCTASASLTIETNTGPQGTLSVTAATCGLSNGSIDLVLDPPQNCDYQWSNGASTQDISNVPPGSYAVTVTDGNGCSSVLETVIPDQLIDIVIQEVITHNTLCVGFDGAIDISVLPVESYSYNWSNGAITEDITELGPGAYTVTVTSGLTCIATDDFEIEDLSNAADINALVTPATCGLLNGAVILQLTGGTGPFSYSWSNGEITAELTDVGPGNYSVTVTGADGCVSFSAMSVPNENIDIAIQATILPNTSCNESNGAIDISASPTENYIYAWSNGATTEDLVNIGAGSYTVTVSFGNTCTQAASFTVTNENIPFTVTGVISPDVSCTQPTGAIDLTVTPVGVYTFAWSNGFSGEDLINLGQGVYEVTVTNVDSCSITSSFIVEQVVTPILISGLTIHNTSCQVPNGNLDISVTPAGTYTYLWSNGIVTEDLNQIGAGNYAVTVTDANGCMADTSFTIQDSSVTVLLAAAVSANTSCTASNGTIDLSVTPAGTYVYSWSTGSSTEDLDSLLAGSYAVTVTDINQCAGIDTFNVVDSVPAIQVSAEIKEDTCDANLGSISLEIIPSGNTYLWSNGAITEDISGLRSGMYAVRITSAEGCVRTDTFMVGNANINFTLTGVVQHATSCITPDGRIDLQIVPAGTYTFVWSNGNGTEDVNLLGPGVYSVTVSDLSGCSSTMAFIVDNVSDDFIIDVQVNPARCNGPTGEIYLAVTPSAGNTFLWSTGSAAEDIIALFPGPYMVTITNSGGCDTSLIFQVPDSSTSISTEATIQPVNDCISPNGEIDLDVFPSGTYAYLWSTGAVTEDLSGLDRGIYSVSISDSFGCMIDTSFVVPDESAFPVVSADVTPATCGQPNGSIDLHVSSPEPYSVVWNTGSTQEDITLLGTGTYEVTVTTAKGCATTSAWTVPDQNSNFSLSAFILNESSCIQANGSIDLTISPPGTYTFTWSNGAGTEDINALASGIYEVTVTDLFSCSIKEVFAVENVISYPVITGETNPPTCGHPNGSIDVSVLPVTVQDFHWSNGATTADIGNLTSGVYTITVTDENGCTASSVFTIPESEGLDIEIQADLSGLGSGVVACSLQLNVPMSTIVSIDWRPDEMMSCHASLCTEQTISITGQTEISATVTDENGCTGMASLMVDIDKEFEVYIPNVFTPASDGPNNRFTVYANKEVEEVVLLEIFDRWGNNVFINKEFPPNDPQFGWDGIYRGKPMNPAVFVYVARVRYSNGELHDYSGDVTIVR